MKSIIHGSSAAQLPSGIKDKAILLGWVAGLLISISLLWIVTQPLQSHYLLRSVNKTFITSGSSMRLSGTLIQNWEKPALFGYWYSMLNTTDRMFVFAVFHDGILVPLGAVVSPNGKVEEIIPLSAHAMQKMENLPGSVILIYTARIEAAVEHVKEKW